MTKATKWEYQFGYVQAAVITEERAFGLCSKRGGQRS